MEYFRLCEALTILQQSNRQACREPEPMWLAPLATLGIFLLAESARSPRKRRRRSFGLGHYKQGDELRQEIYF